jgi:hypothetical protein
LLLEYLLSGLEDSSSILTHLNLNHTDKPFGLPRHLLNW